MTDILVQIRAPALDGTDDAALGYQRWTPSTNRIVDETWVLKRPSWGRRCHRLLIATLDASGDVVVAVAPNEPWWCWKVETVVSGVSGTKSRYVVVPDSQSQIPFTDLIDVDPYTLAPTAEPEAAWVVEAQ